MLKKIVRQEFKHAVVRRSSIIKKAGWGLCLMSASLAQAAEHSVVVMPALTGPSAVVGTSVRDGMLLAIEEANKKQALGAGNSIKPMVVEETSDRNQTITLLQRHAADPSVVRGMEPTSGAAAVAGANGDEAGKALANAFMARFKPDSDGWNVVGDSVMRVAISAMKSAGPTMGREALRAAIAKTREVPVVVGFGKYTLDENRIPDIGMNVVQVQAANPRWSINATPTSGIFVC